jgi:hypothetical protein
MEKIISIVISGRRWLDRPNGNTYHSGAVFVDGTKFEIPFQYGYGESYIDSALDILEKNNVIEREVFSNGAKEPLHYFVKRTGIKVSYEVVDVKTKKDLTRR